MSDMFAVGLLAVVGIGYLIIITPVFLVSEKLEAAKEFCPNLEVVYDSSLFGNSTYYCPIGESWQEFVCSKNQCGYKKQGVD